MPTPEFILRLREKVGNEMLWLIGVTAVVLKDESVLLVQRADNAKVTPVSGIVDPGEEPAVAAARETLEEAAIVAEPEALAWVHVLPPMQYANGDRVQYVDLVFRCRYVSGTPHPADGENTRTWWHPIAELDDAGLGEEMLVRTRTALEHAGSTRFETGPVAVSQPSASGASTESAR